MTYTKALWGLKIKIFVNHHCGVPGDMGREGHGALFIYCIQLWERLELADTKMPSLGHAPVFWADMVIREVL